VIGDILRPPHPRAAAALRLEVTTGQRQEPLERVHQAPDAALAGLWAAGHGLLEGRALSRPLPRGFLSAPPFLLRLLRRDVLRFIGGPWETLSERVAQPMEAARAVAKGARGGRVGQEGGGTSPSPRETWTIRNGNSGSGGFGRGAIFFTAV
jgi:hypothetical protein